MSVPPDLHIVDAHHHLWEIGRFPYPWLAADAPPRPFGDHTAIKRDYLPADYRADFEGLNVVASVHVEANARAPDSVDETAWLQSLGDATGCPDAIVAAEDLTRPDIAARLARHRRHARLRGVRAMAAWDRRGRWRMAAKPGLLRDPAFRRGAAQLADAGLRLDLVVVPEQLEEVADLACALPDLRIAVNHLGQVEPSEPENARTWRRGLEALARCPSVCLKVSGLWTIDRRWAADRLRPFVREVVETFGPARLMYGSNLPVETVNVTAQRQVEVLHDLLAPLGDGVLDQVLRRTACDFYDLRDQGRARS